MGLTEEERFRFDLTGFMVRPAILSKGEVAAIVDQIDRIKHNPESLPPEHRAVPGGPASVLIDHPKVIDVLHAYSHLATHWHRLNIPPVVLENLPREK